MEREKGKDDIKFDEEAKVLYVKLTDEEIEYTKEPFPDIVVDYSQTDKPVGVEILNIKIDPDKV
ncbi:MAG: DUF2283 domain-containing protein [Persephonella sp.]|nr:DUF2283 domain-containing protein [Persephonella sp.]